MEGEEKLPPFHDLFYYKEGKLYWKVNKGRAKKDSVVGSLSKDGYVVTNLSRKIYQVHRIIWYMFNNIMPNKFIDHINHIRDDNRIENLREVEQSENNKNKTLYKNNTSSVTGITQHFGKYRARINVKGKEVYLGKFNTLEEALSIRKLAETIYKFHYNHGGKNLNLNVPIYAGTAKKYLMSLNWLQDVHYKARNKVKQEFHEQIGKILINDKISFKGSIKTHYRLYYKNKLCDAPNVVAVIDKFLLDALQEHNIIVQDNVQYYIASSWEVAGQDRDNPRIEVIIEEC